jgi:hypothetical protein
MPTHEENRETLETFLDISTLAFYRLVYDQFNISGPHGSALGVNLLSPFFPAGEGGYNSYFCVPTKEGRAVIFYLEEPIRICRTTFLHQLENRRGHSIDVVNLPQEAGQISLGSTREMRERVYRQVLERRVDLNDELTIEALEKLREVKRREFDTLGKYASNWEHLASRKEEVAVKIAEARTLALDPKTKLTLPAVSMLGGNIYEFIGVESGMACFRYSGRRGQENKLFPDTLLLKACSINDLPELEAYRAGKCNGRHVQAGFCLKPGADPTKQANWELILVGHSVWDFFNRFDEKTRYYFRQNPSFIP